MGEMKKNNFDIEKVDDLIDFFSNWSKIRPTVVDLSKNRKLSSSERKLIDWLVILADRVSKYDLD